MLKKVIKTSDYDGKPVTYTAYFDLSKMECADINYEYESKGGIVGYLKELVTLRDAGADTTKRQAVNFVRTLVERAYGERPADDPMHFVKEDSQGRPLYKKFRQTKAYDDYVFGLLSGEESFEEFMEHALPQLSDEQKAEAERIVKEEGLEGLLEVSSEEEK